MLPADARADLADRLEQGAAADTPASEGRYAPAFSLDGSRILLALGATATAALGVDYLVRFYTCAPGVSGAKLAMTLAFAACVGGTLVLHSRLEPWVEHEAWQLPPAERGQLADALRRGRPLGRWVAGLPVVQWTVLTGTMAVITGAAIVRYLVHRYGCPGGADAAWRDLLFTVALSPFVFGYLAWTFRRSAREEQAAEAEARTRAPGPHREP
jgi:hypothetical protein